MHAIEGAWLEPMREVRLYAYRLPEGPFERDREAGGYCIARVGVEPLAVVALPDGRRVSA